MSKSRWPRGTRIQSLVFDKRFFSASAARSWASGHGFKAPKTEETPNTIRLRQEPPGRFTEGTFRTIQLDQGVQAVIASPKDVAEVSGRRRPKRKRSRKKRGFDWRDPIGWLTDRLG